MNIPADVSQIPVVSEQVERMLADNGCAPRARTRILIAIDEIINNIANYAYAGGHGEMTVEYGVDGDIAYVRFTDTGIAYNPLDKPDPDTTLSARERDVGGLGIFMVKKTMDNVEYERIGDQNRLTIRKNIR